MLIRVKFNNFLSSGRVLGSPTVKAILTLVQSPGRRHVVQWSVLWSDTTRGPDEPFAAAPLGLKRGTIHMKAPTRRIQIKTIYNSSRAAAAAPPPPIPPQATTTTTTRDNIRIKLLPSVALVNLVCFTVSHGLILCAW